MTQPATAATIDPTWPITTESDPQRVYCSNPVCGGVDVHPHYHRKPGNAAQHFAFVWRRGEKPRLIGPFPDEYAANRVTRRYSADDGYYAWTIQPEEPK